MTDLVRVAAGTGFCVALAVAAPAARASQSRTSEPLSEALRTHLQTERFQIVTSIRGLPLGVRDQLQTLFGSGTLDIADPGAAFRETGAPATPPLPLRRLVAAGCSADSHCLVYYERGGAAVTRRVVLFHWTPAETRFEWGGTAPAGLSTIEAVRKAIVSGEIKGGQTGPW
jgi:hypothetical protein